MTLLERDKLNFNNGKIQERFKIAKSLLDILDDETISLKTDFNIEDVKKLRLEFYKY